jgi:site-specific DNA-methyltransferase (adenine-specific)
MEAMRQMPDKAFELAIVDPEYGRKEHGGKKRSGWVKQKNGSKLFVTDAGYAKKDWDNKPAEPGYFTELSRVSVNQIIFGVNYMPVSLPSAGRIVWDKCNDGSDQSDCEIAYNSMTDRVDIFRYMWRGMFQGKSITEGTLQQGNKALNEKRIHPTQKPVALYEWLLRNYAKQGDKILDTHLGSGSSRIAAYNLGFDFTGYEIDQDYFAAQEERYKKHTAQVRLFDLVEKPQFEQSRLEL